MRIYKISDNAERFQYYAPYGVAVNNSMESDYFGRVYLTETRGGTCSGGRTVTKGLFTLNALLEDDMQQGTNGYNGNVTWNATNSPYRLSVAEDGRIFLCYFSDAHSGIWIADPANLNGTFTELFAGCTRATSGLATYGGVNVHGSISSCYVMGSGADTKLFTTDEDMLTSNSAPNMYQYNIGTATSWQKAPSAVVYERATHKLLINKNNNIMPDGRGGWWISQYRANETTTEPCLVHYNGTKVD